MSDTRSESRKAFEQWYVTHAFDYESNPIGSRDCALQWDAWEAAQTAKFRYPREPRRESAKPELCRRCHNMRVIYEDGKTGPCPSCQYVAD